MLESLSVTSLLIDLGLSTERFEMMAGDLHGVWFGGGVADSGVRLDLRKGLRCLNGADDWTCSTAALLSILSRGV